MGPLISVQQRDKVLGYIQSAKSEGAKLLVGGGQPTHPDIADGYFIEPTVFYDVKPSMRIAREEIFGPVMSIFKWKDEADMFEAVNDVVYGLTASIWTNDIGRAQRASRKVEVGYVWINTVKYRSHKHHWWPSLSV
jgi:betaine-aldehyde dehydrogenase